MVRTEAWWQNVIARRIRSNQVWQNENAYVIGEYEPEEKTFCVIEAFGNPTARDELYQTALAWSAAQGALEFYGAVPPPAGCKIIRTNETAGAMVRGIRTDSESALNFVQNSHYTFLALDHF
jgi:hypothetical protein